MRKLLNTLYITTPESYLSKDGLNVVVTVDKNEIFRIPIMNIEGILSFSYMGASPGLMKLCVDNGVMLTFLTPTGQFIARVQGATKGNVLLRTRQYEVSHNETESLRLASMFVAAKIRNSRSVLQRYLRDNGGNEDVECAAKWLASKKENALKAESAAQLLGIEGEAASTYFGVFDNMIVAQKTDFRFNGRNRRPPKDEVNAMLSFAYTLLAHDVSAALETVGLDPYVGFFHTLRPGRISLALDMMEELRAYMCDRFVLSLVNRRQITKKDFSVQCDQCVMLTDAGRKTFLTAWQSRKKDEIVHPYLNEKISVGLIPYVQAMMLARYLRNDIDDYPVFIVK